MAFRSHEVGGRAQRLPRRRQPRLQVAPLRLHFAASLINLLVAIVVLGLTIAASAGAFFIQRRARRAVGGRSSHAPEERRTVGLPGREDQGAPENPLVTKLRSPKARLALELAGLAVAAVFEGRRDPGARVVGIRRVDARTGEKMSRGQVVVRVGTRQAWQAVTTRVLPWPKVRPPQEDEGFRSEFEAARREYADDQEALQQAVMRIYRQRNVRPVRASCLPIFLRFPLATAIDTPLPWSPLKQSLADKLAGTLVIVERRASLGTRLAAKLR